MNDESKTDALSIGSCVIAGAVLVAGIYRIVAGCTVDEKLGTITLTYFGVAGAILMLRKVKSLSFGDYKAEFQDLQEKADSAMDMAKTAENMARNLSNQSPAAPSTLQESIQPGTEQNDPWKGQFGGKCEVGGRKISAEVKPIKDDPEYFLIRLVVETTDKQKPLKQPVQFYIHDTFPNDKPTVQPEDGIAELRLRAWGAFTVGVIADDGETKLELDLADDKRFPSLFRSR